MLTRATFIPAEIISRNNSGEREAGPSVATIFAFFMMTSALSAQLAVDRRGNLRRDPVVVTAEVRDQSSVARIDQRLRNADVFRFYVIGEVGIGDHPDGIRDLQIPDKFFDPLVGRFTVLHREADDL